MSEARTPRVDGFEIVAADISPVLGSRYRAWAGVARTLERESAALAAENARLRKGLEQAVRRLTDLGTEDTGRCPTLALCSSLLAAKGEGEE